MRTPSMVSEVSAIEVASTTLRWPLGAGAMARSCTAASSAPNSGTISIASVMDPFAEKILGAADFRGPRQERQHRARDRRAAPSRSHPPSAAPAAHRPCGRDSGFRTGKARPSLDMTGASPSSFATRAPSSVADITRMRRSSRRPTCASRASASPRSASSERSWNSSNSTAATPDSSGSSRICREKMPSVTTSILVARETLEPKRTR